MRCCGRKDCFWAHRQQRLCTQRCRWAQTRESGKGRYLRRESFSGTCARSFYVGDVKKEDIHAKFEDGVLHVELPAPQQTKALPENPNLIEIE
nr:Hsp20 family protein [Faecalibacterium sp. OF04-11AC]